MDEIFKKKLTELRTPRAPKSFGEALLQPGDWSLKPVQKSIPKEIKINEEFSEKAQVIESLNRFAEEKTKSLTEPVIKFDGGEIAIKPVVGWEDVPVAESAEELSEFLTLDQGALEALLSEKQPGEVDLLFVTENYHGHEVTLEAKTEFQKQIQNCVPQRTVEFFERMVLAMKIPVERIALYPIEREGEDLADEAMAFAAYLRPKVIIPLGAKATSRILKNNDRLSLIQGQFFTRQIADLGPFTIVPLYHPTIIETNANMKKLTWENMQKIMAHVKNPQ